MMLDGGPQVARIGGALEWGEAMASGGDTRTVLVPTPIRCSTGAPPMEVWRMGAGR